MVSEKYFKKYLKYKSKYLELLGGTVSPTENPPQETPPPLPRVYAALRPYVPSPTIVPDPPLSRLLPDDPVVPLHQLESESRLDAFLIRLETDINSIRGDQNFAGVSEDIKTKIEQIDAILKRGASTGSANASALLPPRLLRV